MNNLKEIFGRQLPKETLEKIKESEGPVKIKSDLSLTIKGRKCPSSKTVYAIKNKGKEISETTIEINPLPVPEEYGTVEMLPLPGVPFEYSKTLHKRNYNLDGKLVLERRLGPVDLYEHFKEETITFYKPAGTILGKRRVIKCKDKK